jgi:hypothetical protein
MAQREIQIDQIIDAMNQDATLIALFAWRIYFGKPVSDTQSGTYVVLNIITKPISEQSYCMVRVEARIIPKDANTTTKSLVDAKNAISTYFESTSVHGAFETFKIVEWGNFYNGIDEKNRNVLIQDYLFYFTVF